MPGSSAAVRPSGRRPLPLTAAAILLFVESAGALALLVWQLGGLLGSGAVSDPTGLAMIVLAAIAMVWAIATGIGALKCRRWIRGSAITWQVLQIAVAVGAFRGFYAGAALAWILLVVAAIGIALVVAPPVARAVSVSDGDAGEEG